MAQEMLQSPQNHVKWGNSNEQTAIGKHLEQNTFDELIITACVQSGLIVNTDAPLLGAIQTSCYIIMQNQHHQVPIFKNTDGLLNDVGISIRCSVQSIITRVFG
jgi:hypothetical protein